MKPSKKALAALMPYPVSVSSTAVNYSNDVIINNLVENSISQAQYYTLANNCNIREHSYRPPVMFQGAIVTPYHPMSYFSRYCDKVVTFMMEIGTSYAYRSISKLKYDDYFERYKNALLQCHEDEAHCKQCRVPCIHCAQMESGYLSAIY